MNNSSDKAYLANLIKMKIETKPARAEYSANKRTRPSTPSGLSNLSKNWPTLSTSSTTKSRKSLFDAKGSGNAGREAFIERKLAEKRQLNLTTIKFDNSKDISQDDGRTSSDLWLSNRWDDGEDKDKPTRKGLETIFGVKKKDSNDVANKRKSLGANRTQNEKSVPKVRERVGSPTMLTKDSSKKDLSVNIRERSSTPKTVTGTRGFLGKNPSPKNKNDQGQSYAVEKRRRSKSALFSQQKNQFDSKGPGDIKIDWSMDLKNNGKDEERETPRLLNESKAETNTNTNDSSYRFQIDDVRKNNYEKDVSKPDESSPTKSPVKDSQFTLRSPNPQSDIEEGTNTYGFNLAAQATSEMQQKEIEMQKVQIDTLKMTIEFLKNENQLLKDSQQQLLKYKEAAKRYRELAQSKTNECISLAEELVKIRKTQNRRQSDRPHGAHNGEPLYDNPRSALISKQIEGLFHMTSGFGGRSLLQEKALLKSMSSVSIGSVADVILEAGGETDEDFKDSQSDFTMSRDTSYLESESLVSKLAM